MRCDHKEEMIRIEDVVGYELPMPENGVSSLDEFRAWRVVAKIAALRSYTDCPQLWAIGKVQLTAVPVFCDESADRWFEVRPVGLDLSNPLAIERAVQLGEVLESCLKSNDPQKVWKLQGIFQRLVERGTV